MTLQRILKGSAILLLCGVGACQQRQPQLPDSEVIQKSAQAVLNARDKSEAGKQREQLRADWRQVVEAIGAYRAGFLQVRLESGSSSHGVDSGARELSAEEGLNQILDLLERYRASVEGLDVQTFPDGEVWGAAFKANLLQKVESIRVEVSAWRGRPAMEQMESAGQLLERIQDRSVIASRPLDETPTISTNLRHR